MITQATISIVGVMLILMTAWSYYAVKDKSVRGRGVYAFILTLALVHMVADGCVRATAGAPETLEWSALEGMQKFYMILFLIGLLGVLQATFDLVWMETHEQTGTGKWIAFHIPAVILVVLTAVMGNTLLSVMLKYMPLLYSLCLFFFAIWFYEKLDRALRIGLLSAMVLCVLIFIGNSVLKITSIPLMSVVIFVVLACSREGDAAAASEEDDEEEIIPVSVPERRTVKKEPVSEDEPVELSELEQMMQVNAGRPAEKLVLDSDEIEVEEMLPVDENPVEEVYPEIVPEIVTEDSISQDEIPVEEFSLAPEEVAPSFEMPDADDILAAGMKAASETVQQESGPEMTGFGGVQQRPLILEKELNEYYHHMREAVEGRDHDRCLEILSEMSEYRISGIYLTRYERIRHAILDEDWDTVEKELSLF